MTRRAAPYLVAIGGAIAITLVIELFASFVSASSLSALYLLLVLWLGARWGRGSAVAGSVAAFLLYDFFFVPPVGTFAVRGPAELLELAVLLAVALVTSQLAASQRRAQASAEAFAADSRALYDLATSMLKANDVTRALELVRDSALNLQPVARFAVVAEGAQVAGAPLTADELRQATWSYDHAQPIGISIKDGAVVPIKTSGAASGIAYLPLRSGVIVVALSAERSNPAELRMLAALIGLADLLLDRRRAGVEAERLRGLAASDRLKTAVLASLSHELKSPIAALRTGLTALIAPKAGLPPEQRQLLSDLDGQASRLDRMVGDLLALSRLEAGVGMDVEPHSLAEVIGASVWAVRPQLNGHEVTVHIPDDLPPVDVDDMQFGRVIGNLLENASEWATPAGGIEVGALVIDDHIEAWVENDGPAIAPTDLDHVFDTFWSRRATGTGLGLAIAKRVVEAHGGTIRAENRRRGPRFTFTVPLARAAVGK
ncbi:MAG TPA: ATP-binding protein [Candidatus Dormibacteraeota bacterium]|nr:ATP-binding protein [Candidatus Dormibacteraeota bacterium]